MTNSVAAPWQGALPDAWSVVPFFTVLPATGASNAGGAERNLLSLSYGRIVHKDIESNDGLLPASFDTYQIVDPGDIVFRFTDLQNDKRSLRSAVVEERGIITSAYLATKPRGCDFRYLGYLMRSYDLMKVFYSFGGGVRQSLSYSDVKRLPVLVPPADLQRRIVDFLDRETAQIDELVAKQERLVRLLRERRSTLIASAVTRGLDPTVHMRSSGIGWLGEVPEGWDVVRARYLCRIQTGDKDTENAVPDGEFPFFVRSQRVESIDSYTFDCEAVLTAGDGAGVGKVYHHHKGKFDAHQRVYVFSGFRRVTGRFFYYYFSALFAKVTLAGTAKSTVESLRRPMLANFPMTVPSLREQDRIVAFLEDECAQIDQLIDKANTTVAVLHERRASLTSAAVTGSSKVLRKIEKVAG